MGHLQTTRHILGEGQPSITQWRKTIRKARETRNMGMGLRVSLAFLIVFRGVKDPLEIRYIIYGWP